MTSFDQLTKGIANQGLSRRDGLKLAVGGAAAAAMSAIGFGATVASAANLCAGIPGNCSVGFSNCPQHANTNCFCFQHRTSRSTFCGCNQFCSTSAPCSFNTDCSFGHACSGFNGCDCSGATGVCIRKCGIRNRCVLQSAPASGDHRTAA